MWPGNHHQGSPGHMLLFTDGSVTRRDLHTTRNWPPHRTSVTKLVGLVPLSAESNRLRTQQQSAFLRVFVTHAHLASLVTNRPPWTLALYECIMNTGVWPRRINSNLILRPVDWVQTCNMMYHPLRVIGIPVCRAPACIWQLQHSVRGHSWQTNWTQAGRKWSCYVCAAIITLSAHRGTCESSA